MLLIVRTLSDLGLSLRKSPHCMPFGFLLNGHHMQKIQRTILSALVNKKKISTKRSWPRQ